MADSCFDSKTTKFYKAITLQLPFILKTSGKVDGLMIL